jgi:predicted PurR-regulated permease PerM
VPLNKELIVKFEKWLIWGATIGIVLLLRHLFPVIFITFVLTYMGHSLVMQMTRRLPYRRLNLVAVYTALLLLIAAMGLIVVPRMFAEARNLARLYVAQEPGAPAAPPAPVEDQVTVIDPRTQRIADAVMIQLLGREAFQSYRQSESYGRLLEQIDQAVEGFIPRIVDGVRQFVNGAFVLTFHFLLSIIFSFLILWDLPRLRQSLAQFAHGRTAEIYAEVAPGIRAFVVMLGRAFEAQSLIALVNTLLTSIGFFILGIPSIALLAPIVFFCSYIPVFGVILSSLPAALLAFRTGGVMLVFWLLVMILIVHAIEAYALNPLIFGHHLRMHPVAVLLILLIAEHLFGIWGLVLAVPIAAFILRYVIRGEDVAAVPVAGKPPAVVAATPGN